MSDAVKTEHPHIVLREGICGGEPVIDGLRVSVRHVVTLHQRGETIVDLRGPGFDVLTTEEAGYDTASDNKQLEFATAEKRAILTFHIRDFAPLHFQWQSAGRPHAGIIVSRQLGSREYGVLLQRMLRLLNHISAEQMIGNIVHLEQFK